MTVEHHHHWDHSGRLRCCNEPCPPFDIPDDEFIPDTEEKTCD